jgi:hypothetical protein
MRHDLDFRRQMGSILFRSDCSIHSNLDIHPGVSRGLSSKIAKAARGPRGSNGHRRGIMLARKCGSFHQQLTSGTGHPCYLAFAASLISCW